MMMKFGRPQVQAPAPSNGRVAIIATAVFLLSFGLVARLVYLQIFEHSRYSALAEGQHKTSYELLPERGKIYIQENALAGNDLLYPIAVNKDFALLFAVPKKIIDPEKVSEQLYEFFKKASIEKEAAEMVKKEREENFKTELASFDGLPEAERGVKLAETKSKQDALLNDLLFQELEKQKIEDYIREKKEASLASYIKALDQQEDEYEPIERKLSDDVLKKFYVFMSGRSDIVADDLTMKNGMMVSTKDQTEFEIEGFGYSLAPHRFYPENNIGANILGFAGYENEEQRGKYGLEGFFDQELFGKFGSVTAERGAGGLVIVNDRQTNKKEDGSSLVLTIDRAAQFNSCKMLDEAVNKYKALGGSVIVVNPKDGAILVMCSAPDFDPNNYQKETDLRVFNNPAVFDQYEPGSVFKAITMAGALDTNKVTPETTYQDNGQIIIKGWPKPIKNSDFETFGGHGKTNMVTVLEQSLNTGAIFAMQQTGVENFADYVRHFGFGEKTGIELEGESAGDIRNISGFKVKDISAATASFGQGITVTPLQMVMSYAAIANGGKLMKPYIVKAVVAPDGSRSVTTPSLIRQVISERSAAILTGMLINVVENGHSKLIQIPGYYIAGKTGTAQIASASSKGYTSRYNHTFVGYAPANNASFVILTKIDSPQTSRFAEGTAVPLAHDITKFLLNHWQIPQDRKIETNVKK